MNNTLRLGWALLAICLFVAGCGDANTSPRTDSDVKIGDTLTVEHFGSEELASSIIGANKIVVVDFTADWCGPCQSMKPALYELDKEGAAKLVMIDVDKNKGAARAFGVSAIPFLVFVKDGKWVDSSTGFMSKQDLLKQIEKNK